VTLISCELVLSQKLAALSNSDILKRLVTCTRLYFLSCQQYGISVDDTPKESMLAIEMRRRLIVDKELGAIGVRATVCH